MDTCGSRPWESGSVRIGHSLNKNEEKFVARRRKKIQKSLNKLNIPCSDEYEVPNIALLGSGGGQRAMVGLLVSLDQLQKAGLLECVLYLSGVSGSTWCMASLYQESDWSTKLETVKEKIIQRLGGPALSLIDVKRIDYFAPILSYKKIPSLTDLWAVTVITKFVKEIDEHTPSDQWDKLSRDPFPIYTVIDKQSKQSNDADPWFEITPCEAGYSLIGAFVETSSFGSKFENGSKIEDHPEIDMLYLQALCGSAIADGDENNKFLYELIKKLSGLTILDNLDGVALPTINYLTGFASQYFSPSKDVDLQEQWTWGRNYNFLYGMNDKAVPAALLKSETRDYIDAGVLLNSPYFSVLREERDIDLIISLDFSDGDPFMTVREAAETCKKLKIPFPEVSIPKEDVKKPKDFYVFKGQNTPTVIHIPLFNVVNCGDDIEKWRNKYQMVQDSYSAEMITDLMEVAGKNITNNRDNLLEQIRLATEKKKL
ncbi:hypothetical protein R3I93_002555 [Phoxinus phoxinus]|uniref:PLA2c domain-containing protein n=1 Tax=Phoxinus phoxinus TaxID=58324 RepID=A0AAN9DG37_9TELE